MSLKTLIAYTPPFTQLICPHPMQALDLYFTAQWLPSKFKQPLLDAQRKCRETLPPQLEDIPGLDEHRLQYLGSISGEWMQHPTLGMLPPLMAVTISARHDTAQELAAQDLFSDELTKAFKRSKTAQNLQQFYNPVLVWYAVVLGNSIDGETPVEVLMLRASRQIVDLVIDGGEEKAVELAQSIVSAIEIDFNSRQT